MHHGLSSKVIHQDVNFTTCCWGGWDPNLNLRLPSWEKLAMPTPCWGIQLLLEVRWPHTVDGSEIRRSPVEETVVYLPLFLRGFSTISGGWPWDFWIINSITIDEAWNQSDRKKHMVFVIRFRFKRPLMGWCKREMWENLGEFPIAR